MWILAAFALAGGLAQLVDGTLGMGFGVTSATVLLFLGVAPATASAATHAAKLPTTFVSGLSHWRVGNVETAVLWRVALPGAVGGFLGAVVLTSIDMASAKSWMSGLLLFFGVVIFARFGLRMQLIPTTSATNARRALSPIGLLGGFVDATGGGGWGPVVTPSLMTVTDHEPRKVVGTVSAAEFIVALSVSFGFLTGAAQHGIPWLPVIGLAAGGVLVAPVAARLAGRLPHAPMGTLVGGAVIVVNGITVIDALGGAPGWLDATLLLTTVVLTASVAWTAWARERGALHHTEIPGPLVADAREGEQPVTSMAVPAMEDTGRPQA